MDILNIQALIKEGKIVSQSDINLDETYLQVGVFQPGNRKSGASNPNAYASYAISLNTLAPSPIQTIGTTLYSTNPSVGTNFSQNDNNIFLGLQAGQATGSITNSNFIGKVAGSQASNASNSTFIGFETGCLATNADNSNFIGYNAGFNAINAARSNFLGYRAGYAASNAFDSNFLGYQAGYGASYSENCNFIGKQAGKQTGSVRSNFLGYQAGFQCNASYSNCIGHLAGAYSQLTFASVFIGSNAGYNSQGNYVVALGYEAGKSNFRSGQFIISNNSLPSYASRAAAQTAIPTGSIGSTYLYYNSTSGAIEGLRF